MTAVTATLNPGTSGEAMFAYSDAAVENDSLQKGTVYSLYLAPIPETQNSDLVIQTTFSAYPIVRQKQQRIRILPTPIEVAIATDVDASKQKVLIINVIPDSGLIFANTLLVNISMQDNDGKILKYQIPQDKTGKHKLLISPDPGITSYNIQFDLAAKTLQGREIKISTAPTFVTVPSVTLPEPKIITIQPEKPKKVVEEHPKPLSLGKTMLLVMLFLVVNIMILSIIYILTKLIKRQRSEKITIMSKNIR